MAELADYLEAGYPALMYRAAEPDIAQQQIVKTVESLQLDVGIASWKATKGMRYVGRENERAVAEDLLDALQHVETSQESLVVIFHNIRHFISNYQVIQAVVDAAMAARLKGSHLIFVGPHCDFPPELRHLVTVLDSPLPSVQEIEEQYDKVLQAYSDTIDLPSEENAYKSLLRQASEAAIGLPQMGAENALALSLAVHGSVKPRTIQEEKEHEIRKSDVLEFIKTSNTMEEVGGFSNLKSWLKRRRRAFSDEARAFGLPYPKGMLMVGPAGTGKSLTAKAAATFLGLPLIRLDMGKVFKSLVGESEAAIRQALQVVEAVSPVVLWLDEIEKGLAGSQSSGELDSGVTSRVISTLLTWRQETQKPVVMMATANDVRSLPSMVYRKGRLDEVWATDLPNPMVRSQIFEIHLRKRKRNPKDFDLQALATKSNTFTGAEIEGCVEDALFSAFDEGKKLQTRHILKAIEETIPQYERDEEEVESVRRWAQTRARMVDGQSEMSESEVSDQKIRHISTTTKKKK